MFGVQNDANNFGYSAGLLANTIANRPNRAALGTLFVSTDTLLLYRWTGSAWVEISGGGGGGPFINGVTNLGAGVGLGGSLDQDTEILLNGLSFKLTNNGDNLLIDTVNDLYYFGKGNALDAGLGIHVTENTIYTRYSTSLRGLNLDFTNYKYQLGDYNLDFEGTYLEVHDSNQSIITYFGNSEKGLKLNFCKSSLSIRRF